MQISTTKRKQFIMNELDLIRARYQQQFEALALGIKFLEYTLEAMERGDGRVIIRNGSWVSEEPLDADFFKRNGITPINHCKKMYDLLDEQIEEEYQFRTHAVRQYIQDSGLESNTDEIIAGVNQTAERVTIWPDTLAKESHNPLRCRDVLQHDMRAMLEFALTYVDRWQLYNELFGQD